MRIIGFIASPQKEGNTAWIVNKILEGAKEQGAETQSWSFSDLDIKPCQGCLSCHQGDRDRGCIINDDMQKLYDAIEHADALVLGSPIYMGQMSAQAKIFTDRLFALISPRFLRLIRVTLIPACSRCILIIRNTYFSCWNLML